MQMYHGYGLASPAIWRSRSLGGWDGAGRSLTWEATGSSVPAGGISAWGNSDESFEGIPRKPGRADRPGAKNQKGLFYPPSDR
jgi:hypothetical protein